jgi:hypothetical protein
MATRFAAGSFKPGYGGESRGNDLNRQAGPQARSDLYYSSDPHPDKQRGPPLQAALLRQGIDDCCGFCRQLAAAGVKA